MSSCAVQEIVGVSTYLTSEECMMGFCQQVLGDKGDCLSNGGYSAYSYQRGRRNNGNIGPYTEGLGENYVFHGVEPAPSNKCFPKFLGSSGYCSRFATFIMENKLGHVVSGQLVANHRYHPEHRTAVFLWNPDREAVKAWWRAHKPKPTPETVTSAPPYQQTVPEPQAQGEVPF